jgi:hypothetical protein
MSDHDLRGAGAQLGEGARLEAAGAAVARADLPRCAEVTWSNEADQLEEVLQPVLDRRRGEQQQVACGKRADEAGGGALR